MSFLAWIVLGLISGFIGSKIVNKRGDGIIIDIFLGIVGAIAGGWLAGFFGLGGVSGLNLYSFVGHHRLGGRAPGVSRDPKSRVKSVLQNSRVIDDFAIHNGQDRTDLLDFRVRHGEIIAVQYREIG